MNSNIPLTPRSLPRFMQEVIITAWKGQDTAVKQEGLKEVITGPTVTWRLIRRLPGRDGVERHGARQRAVTPGKDSNQEINRYAQWNTMWYEWTAWATTPEAADDLADRLESTLMGLAPLLSSLGVINYYFDEESQEITDYEVKEDDIHIRRMRYVAVLERTYEINSPVLRSVFLKTLYNPTRVDSTSITRGTTLTDTLPNKWLNTLYAVSAHFIHNASLTTADLTNANPPIYVNGIDYTISSLSDGTCFIHWIPGMASPSVGSTYYVTYDYFTAEVHNSAL